MLFYTWLYQLSKKKKDYYYYNSSSIALNLKQYYSKCFTGHKIQYTCNNKTYQELTQWDKNFKLKN
jgi:hypothetical protein